MNMTALIAAALVAAVAAPAMADPATVKATYDAKHDKYCVSQEVTGQRIPVRDCRTKAEWAASGANLGEKAKKTDTMKLAQK